MDAPDSCSAQALGLPEHRASVQRDRPGQAGALAQVPERWREPARPRGPLHGRALRGGPDRGGDGGHDRPADARGRVLRAPWPDINWHSMHINVSIRQLRALALTQLRAKIAAVTAKGGLPDAGAPNDYESMRF